jgi:REP element-mobilizing transposase RayT
MQNKPEYTRALPHYHHYGAVFFVTFRLYGSLPQEFLEKLAVWYESEKKRIAVETKGKEQEKAKALLQRDYFRKFDHALDQCLFGPTFLKEPEAAQKVVEQLNRFDGQWYKLIAFTVLPNHVHALLDFSIQLNQNCEPEKASYKNLDFAMGRIKGASARYVNLVLDRTGNECWQSEYHDRYIRDRKHLIAAIDYIKQNPVSANICNHWLEHPFTWVHEDF